MFYRYFLLCPLFFIFNGIYGVDKINQLYSVIDHDKVLSNHSPNILKYGLIKLNQSVVTKNSGQEVSFPSRFSIDLLGTSYQLWQKSLIQRNRAYFTWVGKIEGDPLSLAVITYRNGHLAATLTFNGQSWGIKPIGDNLQLLYKEDEEWGRKRHQELMEKLVYPEIERDSNPTKKDDDGTSIDLMVVYTSSAASASADIEAEIQNDVDYTNEALANSCVSFRYRLVHTEVNNYANDVYGISSVQALVELADPTDGVMDSIHTSRATSGADLVQIWTQNIADACGIGYAPPDPNSMNGMWGFSLKNRNCSASTTAHELGHNLTLSHDRYQEEVSMGDYLAPYGDGYGFVDPNLKVTTIMSYTTECRELGVSCSRIPYFSNPRIVYQGVPLGKPGLINEAHKLNMARVTGANYVESVTLYSVDVTSGCQAVVDSKEKQAPCFLATAAFGSPWHPHVQILRQFRGDILMQSQMGRDFVHWYYRISPPLANWIENHQWARYIISLLLMPIVYSVVYPLLALSFMGTIFIILPLSLLMGLKLRRRV